MGGFLLYKNLQKNSLGFRFLYLLKHLNLEQMKHQNTSGGKTEYQQYTNHFFRFLSVFGICFFGFQ